MFDWRHDIKGNVLFVQCLWQNMQKRPKTSSKLEAICFEHKNLVVLLITREPHILTLWTVSPSTALATISHLTQFSTMFCSKMKSKLKFSLLLFAFLYGVFKLVQFSIYLRQILKVILNEDCEGTCVVELCEMALLTLILIPLSIFLCGVIKVNKLQEGFWFYLNILWSFKLKQSYVGLWLVIHTIILGLHCFVQYQIRFGPDSSEYTRETVENKSIEFGEF